MRGILWPDVAVQPRATAQERYVRSYVMMRAAIGALGLALPVVLVTVEPLLFDGQPWPRGSLSAYYYSGLREIFVGVLWAIGVFLIIYKLPERSRESILSTLAGLAVIVVAVFPTGKPGRGVAPTPLQDLLGETTVEAIHFGAAAVFISSLAVISWYFSAPRSDEPAARRSRWHLASAGVIVAALGLAAVAGITGEPDKGLLAAEWLGVWAFALSWLRRSRSTSCSGGSAPLPRRRLRRPGSAPARCRRARRRAGRPRRP